MSAHNFHFLLVVALFVAVHVAMLCYYLSRTRRLAGATWQQLMAKLARTDRYGIAEVALASSDMEESQLWDLLGGLDGLQVLEKNSEVLVELAFYLQHWYPEALIIAERLRRDARELHWHVARLRGAADTGNLQVSFPFYARRAVLTYYEMRERVLALYEEGHFAGLSDLQQAL